MALTVAPGLATAAPTVTRVATPETGETTPAGEPTEETTPPVEPTAPASDPATGPPTLPPDPDPTPSDATPTTVAPTTSAPAPAPTTTTRPPTTAPAPPPPGGGPVPPPAPPPGEPGGGRTGVRVTTGDISLGPGYWNARSTVTTLRVTVTNTGATSARIRLGYTLPAGITDAGTPGCSAAGGGAWRCGEWTAAAGARFSSAIKVRVGGTAWRQMPLSGSVRVTATGADTGAVTADDEGFAVLFPPGPPVPGIKLAADEVAFDISGTPTELAVRLGNTGKVDAAGRIEVILPAGVSVPNPPAGCEAAGPTRTRCDVGTVAAGRTAALRLPVAASPEAQRQAPLAGALLGKLDPHSGRTRQMQMSFRINAAAALATPAASTPTPTGSQGVLAVAGQASGDDGMSSVQQIAVALIAVSGVLVVLALALATASLRRRMSGPVTDPAGNPASD
ncbi:hypothetical protein [Micromonospora psammae]|uniref:hypothetical protein n=1 Tax=Micromonospora sp. CPCC 205556 TaxID=3122398 RepID=UPI002FF388C7